MGRSERKKVWRVRGRTGEESTVLEGTAMRQAAKGRSRFRFRFVVEASQ